MENSENQCLDNECLENYRQAAISSTLAEEYFEDLKTSANVYKEYKNSANTVLNSIKTCSARLVQTKDLLNSIGPFLSEKVPKAAKKLRWLKRIKEKREAKKAIILQKFSLQGIFLTFFMILIENELKDAIKSDISSFKKFLLRKQAELDKLQKEISELNECAFHMKNKQENLQKELEEIKIQKQNLQINPLKCEEEKEWKKLESDENSQKLELEKIHAIVCENIEKSLSLFNNSPILKIENNAENIESSLQKCIENLLKLIETNSNNFLKAYYKMKQKEELYKFIKRFTDSKYSYKTFLAFRKEVSEQKAAKLLAKQEQINNNNFSEIPTQQPHFEDSSKFEDLARSIEPEKPMQITAQIKKEEINFASTGPLKKSSKEELKNKVDHLIQESLKSQPNNTIENSVLENTYKQMLSEANTVAPILQRIPKKSNFQLPETQITPMQAEFTQKTAQEERKSTTQTKEIVKENLPKISEAQPQKKPLENSTKSFLNSNLSFIFPSTYNERADKMLPIVNEGLPLSTFQSPEEAEKMQKRRKTSRPPQQHEEEGNQNENNTGFVPLVFFAKKNYQIGTQ